MDTGTCQGCSKPIVPDAPALVAPGGGSLHPGCWPAVCARCSKPIVFGTGITLDSAERVHVRCLARDRALASVEAQDQARAVQESIERQKGEAARLLGELRALKTCPACQRPLSSGGGLLFEGERLVHAACWRDPRKGRDQPADGSSPVQS